MSRSAHEVRAHMATGSKSFWLASRFLGPRVRDDAAAVYAYCRRADDAVDLAPPGEAAEALEQLCAELGDIFGDAELVHPVLGAFQDVVRRRGIPRAYVEDLLEGMAMDVAGVRYEHLDDTLLYAYRAAGTVGLMMCHVFGVESEGALPHAVHLGMAMQLTNICRDVAEDWARGRLYVPQEVLVRHGARALVPGGPRVPESGKAPLSRAVRDLLALADRYYASGRRGMHELPFRAGTAVRAAGLLYAAIGRRIAAQGYDVTRGRAVVPRRTKVVLLTQAILESLALSGRRRSVPAVAPKTVFPRDTALHLASTKGRP